LNNYKIYDVYANDNKNNLKDFEIKNILNNNNNSLEYSQSKAGDLIESKNYNFIKGRKSLIEKFKKDNNSYLHNKIKKENIHEVDFSKFKIYKQDSLEKEKNANCRFNSNGNFI